MAGAGPKPSCTCSTTAGSWQPVRLDDGTLCDGRVETYTRCVEFICGSAETFFTSVFAAQGKRQLSSYRNAEIKALLADLLGQEQIRALGQQAAETARLLKAGLSAVRQEQAGLDDELQRLEASRQRLDAARGVAWAESAKQAAHTALDAAQARHARLVFESEQSRAIEARRVQLTAERQAVFDADVQTRHALGRQDQVERERLAALDRRIARRLQQDQARRQSLAQSRQRCVDTLGEAKAVRRAALRLPLAKHIQGLRAARTLAARERTQRLAQCQAAVQPGRTEIGRHRARCRKGCAAGTKSSRVGSASPAQCLVPAPTCSAGAICCTTRTRRRP